MEASPHRQLQGGRIYLRQEQPRALTETGAPSHLAGCSALVPEALGTALPSSPGACRARPGQRRLPLTPGQLCPRRVLSARTRGDPREKQMRPAAGIFAATQTGSLV